MVRAEKILYYTLEKVQQPKKLNTNAQFYFCDCVDALLLSEVYSSSAGKKAALFCTGHDLMLTMDGDREQYCVREVGDLGVVGADNNIGEKTMFKEYTMMIFSYLRVLFGIEEASVRIYEDESSELASENALTLREEALSKAPLLAQIYALLRKGTSK